MTWPNVLLWIVIIIAMVLLTRYIWRLAVKFDDAEREEHEWEEYYRSQESATKVYEW